MKLLGGCKYLLRKLSLKDLLGCDLISLDWRCIHSAISEKVVLVTEGGGSPWRVPFEEDVISAEKVHL